MPFRSEDEQVREQIRRVEEQARELLEEQADLQRQVGVQRGRRSWVPALLVTLAGGSLLGYAGGALAAAARTARFEGIRMREERLALERELEAQIDCAKSEERARNELAWCQHELAETARRAGQPPLAVRPACRCAAGDPQCQCLFARDAAASALGAAQSAIDRCITPRRDLYLQGRSTLSFHTKITFSPTGRVDDATIDSPANLTEAEKTCVVAVLRKVEVPAFSGAPVRVGKKYDVRP